jgi:hypothetical protein
MLLLVGLQKLKRMYIIRQIKSRQMRWAGYVAGMGEERKLFKILVRKPEGSPRRRWEDVIRRDVREIGWGGGVLDLIRLTQDRDR